MRVCVVCLVVCAAVYGPLHQMAAAQGVINASRQLWSHVTRAMDVFAQPQPGAQVPPGQLLGSMGVNTYSQALGKLVPATNMLIKSVALNQTAGRQSLHTCYHSTACLFMLAAPHG